MYISAVQKDVLELYRKQVPFNPKLSVRETKAMHQLASRQEIVIKPAHKGGAVVNRSNFVAKADRQLADQSFYQPVDSDPTNQFKDVLKNTLLDLYNNNQIRENDYHSIV